MKLTRRLMTICLHLDCYSEVKALLWALHCDMLVILANWAAWAVCYQDLEWILRFSRERRDLLKLREVLMQKMDEPLAPVNTFSPSPAELTQGYVSRHTQITSIRMQPQVWYAIKYDPLGHYSIISPTDDKIITDYWETWKLLWQLSIT